MTAVKKGVATPLVGSNGTWYTSINELAREVFGNVNISKRLARELKRDGKIVDSITGTVFTTKADEPPVLQLTDNVSEVTPELKKVQEEKLSKEDRQDLEAFRQFKDVQSLPFEKYTFNYSKQEHGVRYAVALFSDAHIEEVVDPNGVLGLNKYDPDIAKERVEKYFVNLARCLMEDQVTDLIFASLGDTISGFIHEELAQTNGMSPLEATFLAQNLIYNGLNYIVDTCTDLETIKFIGIVGNHSRTTKKIQHSNGFKLSYEWLMYQNIKQQCELQNMPIEFCLPESEVAIIETPDQKKLMFCHGFQIKAQGTNTVCGIYPALNRLNMKWKQIFNQDKIYLGHFHSCIAIPNVVVNGSIIGYNTFALSNGFAYEEPAQMYQVFDSNMGELLTRKIYCR